MKSPLFGAYLTFSVFASSLHGALPFPYGNSLVPRLSERDVDNGEVQEMAKFSVDEMRKLSSSGVYETLELHRVISASAGEGIFHYNYLLELELASQHLRKGAVSRHHVLVMCSLEDGSLSLALDDFPEMNAKAIEMFWVARVESHRRSRNASFRAMESEWIQRHGEATSPLGQRVDIATLKRRSTRDIRTMFRDPLISAARRAMLRDMLDSRWEKLELLKIHDEL